MTSPGDDSPWSASTGPWRAVGVRKQRLVFALPAESGAAAGEAVEAGLEAASIECLADGGYVVEVGGARFAVSGAELDPAGRMTASVDGRRVWRRAVFREATAQAERGRPPLWSRPELTDM